MIAREDRDRYDDRARRPTGSEVPRKILGRIVDGGHMPGSTDDGQVVYLLERVDVDFAEEPGATATITGSGARFTAVRVGGKGPKAPAVGDVVICRPIGDRLGFTWAGGKGPHVRLWVLSRATPTGFFPSSTNPPLNAWGNEAFDPDAGDGSRFRVFAFWRYDVDSGANVVTTGDLTPSAIPTKQHLYDGPMTDVTPTRIDHPWGYLEIPADTGGVHAANLNPAGSIVVRVIDTEGDPTWELVALLPARGPVVPVAPSGTKQIDLMEVLTYALRDVEFAVRDNLTWYCPGYKSRPSPPGTTDPATDHTFAEAHVSIDYHNVLTLPFSPPSIAKDVTKTTEPAAPNGYWQYRRPIFGGGTILDERWLDNVTNASVPVGSGIFFGGSFPGQYRGNHYTIDSPDYVPASLDVGPSTTGPTDFPGQFVVGLCARSYGYVSTVGSPPYTTPGCTPPWIEISISATGIWDGHQGIASTGGFVVPAPSPITIDLAPYFGPATGQTTRLPLVVIAPGPGVWPVNFASGPMKVAANGPFLFVGGSYGSTLFTLVFPHCTGARPTTGDVFARFPSIYDSFGNVAVFTFRIGTWKYP
jgi:hypothetical protein